MLLIFQRFHRELFFLLIVLLGLACGHLAMTILERNVRSDSPMTTKSVVTPTASQRTNRIEDLNFILQRNLFDPDKRGTETMGATRGASRSGSEPVGERKDLTLLGTMVAGADSVALIKDKREIKLYLLDQELPDGGRIETIERNLVTIRNRDRSQSTLGVQEDAARGRIAPPAAGGGPGVVAVGPNRWKVASATAQSARDNIAEQLRLATMEPRVTNGRTDGFVIKLLSRRSLLSAMGLQRGDVVLQVNSMRLDSPEKALQIMQQLREARKIAVDIERNSQPMTLTYELE